MSEHLDWLLRKREEYQEQFDDIQRKLAACEEMIAAAKQDQAGAARKMLRRVKRPSGGRTNLDIALDMLKRCGSLTSREMVKGLSEEGRTTTTSSLNTSLYRLKREGRLDRNKDGKWSMIDPEERTIDKLLDQTSIPE